VQCKLGVLQGLAVVNGKVAADQTICAVLYSASA